MQEPREDAASQGAGDQPASNPSLPDGGARASNPALPASASAFDVPRESEAGDAASPTLIVVSTTRRAADPWAHRRGEPRVFALLWTVFLFVGTSIVFYGAMSGPSISPELMRPAARLLLILMALGIGVLWPMVRLSQAPDAHPLSGALKDLLVIMIPAQSLIWPQALWWLARWPVDTVLAVACALAAWGLLIGGLIAASLSGSAKPGGPEAGTADRPLRLAAWMLVFTLLTIGGPLAALFGGAGAAHSGGSAAGDVEPVTFDALLMLSPVGSMLELTRDTTWSGRATTTTASHWGLIVLVAVAAALAWTAAAARSRRAGNRLGLSLER